MAKKTQNPLDRIMTFIANQEPHLYLNDELIEIQMNHVTPIGDDHTVAEILEMGQKNPSAVWYADGDVVFFCPDFANFADEVTKVVDEFKSDFPDQVKGELRIFG